MTTGINAKTAFMRIGVGSVIIEGREEFTTFELEVIFKEDWSLFGFISGNSAYYVMINYFTSGGSFLGCLFIFLLCICWKS